MSTITDDAARSLTDDTREIFERRVSKQANRIRSDIETGKLDNAQFALGFELELYAVTGDGRLTAMPQPAFADHCDKELGRHNAEYNTTPTIYSTDGVQKQLAELSATHAGVCANTEPDDTSPILDGMWTIPPPQGTESYLSAGETENDVRIAENMTPSARYVAIDNEIVTESGGSVVIDVPGVTATFPSILVESLTSSIQPHIQIPRAEMFPAYHTVGVRTLGPVLSIGTNSPLLPYDLYDLPPDPKSLLSETYHELRIPVFEQSINGAWEKVRFPVDIGDARTVVDELEADQTCAPFLREWVASDEPRDSFRDMIWEIDHKRGTYWRWLRAVIGGQPVGDGSERSIRLEYRPIPTQPTIAENIGFQAFVAGLLRGLVENDHPVIDLPLEDAEASFYRAVRDGPEAELHWLTETGNPTTDRRQICMELFAYSRRGLRDAGLSPTLVDTLLTPLERRVEEGITPSQWKLDRVRHYLEAGDPFEDAVTAMQQDYNARSGGDVPVVDW